MLKRKVGENVNSHNSYATKSESVSGFYSPNESQHAGEYVGSQNNRYQQVTTNTQQRQFTYNYPAYDGEANRSNSEFSRTTNTMHRSEIPEILVDGDEVFDEPAVDAGRYRSSVRRTRSQHTVANSQNAHHVSNNHSATANGDASTLASRSVLVSPQVLGSQPLGYYAMPTTGNVLNMIPEQQLLPGGYAVNGIGLNNMLVPNGGVSLPTAYSVSNGNIAFPNYGMPFPGFGTMRPGVLPTGVTVGGGEQVIIQNGSVASSIPSSTGIATATHTEVAQRVNGNSQSQSMQVSINKATSAGIPPVTITQSGATSAAQKTAAVKSNRPSAEVLKSMPKGPPSADLFERIRKYCRQNGVLYEDPDFPATNESLFNASSDPQSVASYRDAPWLRPGEVVKRNVPSPDAEPALFVKGVDRFDLDQGALGNCWVLAAIAAFCERKELVQQVIPAGQSFAADWYAGIFRFRFARMGEWRDVIIDDRLPTRDGKLLFVHAPSFTEFWGALLEKAYAKLAGCYANLDGGRFEDSMLDLTDGLAEDFDLPKIRSNPAAAANLEGIMLHAFSRDSIMCAGINPPEANGNQAGGAVGKNNEILANDLVLGHAYTVTNVQTVQYPYVPGKAATSKITLVRIRNPWGNTEWNGAFSDDSPEWNQVPPDFRTKFNSRASDGEFWMTAKDFIGNFDRLSLCHLAPELCSASAKSWQAKRFSNHWIKGLNAGGRPILKDTHCTNPQYHIGLQDDGRGTREQTILVEIQQPDIRHLQSGASASADRTLCYKPVGFVIYRAPAGATFPLPKEYIKTNEYVARCDNFVTNRSYAKRFSLPVGDYVIVPCTSDANVESEFFLQVYCEQSCTMKDDNTSGSTRIPAETVHDRVEKVPPLGAKQQEVVRSRFIRLAGNENGDLPAHLVPALLKNISISELPREIPIDLAKTLVHYVSDSCTLKMTLKETYKLVQVLVDWCNMFREFDKDHSTTLDASEMQSLLSRLGYSLDMGIIKQLVLRYCDERGQLDLTNSLFCIAKLAAISKLFAANSNGESELSSDNQISFTLKSLLISVALI